MLPRSRSHTFVSVGHQPRVGQEAYAEARHVVQPVWHEHPGAVRVSMHDPAAAVFRVNLRGILSMRESVHVTHATNAADVFFVVIVVSLRAKSASGLLDVVPEASSAIAHDFFRVGLQLDQAMVMIAIGDARGAQPLQEAKSRIAIRQNLRALICCASGPGSERRCVDQIAKVDYFMRLVVLAELKDGLLDPAINQVPVAAPDRHNALPLATKVSQLTMPSPAAAIAPLRR